jgi:hypothetical protein
MKKNIIKLFLLTVVLIIITITGATAAPVGMENFKEFYYSGPGAFNDGSLKPFKGRHQEDINLNDFGDYSKWCQTYTFHSGSYHNDDYIHLSDVNFDADMIWIEHCDRIRPAPAPAPVPEPGTLTLLGLGLVSAGAILRKRLPKKPSAI